MTELLAQCKELLNVSNKYNLASAAKHIKLDVIKATQAFPDKITLSQRIRAIADNNACICPYCGKVHGNPYRDYCNQQCYTKHTTANAISNKINKLIQAGEIKYAGLVEGVDYLVCQVCGCKCQDVGKHSKIHGLSATEYKLKFGIKKTKADIICKYGADNPGYQHGGKFSKWSKNYIHGYDEVAHKEFKEKQSKCRTNNPTNHFSRAHYSSDAEYSKAQSRGLDYFIRKYGDAGIDKWHNKNMNMQVSQPIMSFKSLWTNRSEVLGHFYILKISTDKIKIGITTRKVVKRYCNSVDVIVDLECTISIAFMIEQLTKRQFINFLIDKNDAVTGFGWTETFNINCLEPMLKSVDTYVNNTDMLSTDFKSTFKLKYPDRF